MSAGEIMVPASDADVGRLAVIEALRVSHDQMSRVANSVEKISDQMTQVAKDVAVLKAHDTRSELEKMANRQSSIDERLFRLLEASTEDRKALWIANEALKGQIKNLTDKVLPIFGLLATVGAAVVAFIMDRVLR